MKKQKEEGLKRYKSDDKYRCDICKKPVLVKDLKTKNGQVVCENHNA